MIRGTRVFCAILLFTVLFASANGVSAQTTVVLVRHAARAPAPADDPPLTEEGRARAARLAEYLAAAKVDVVYSTPFARTRETAAPLVSAATARLIEMPIRGNVADYAQQLAERIRKENANQTVVVIGHSNTTPVVVKALTGVDVPQIAADEYDNLYVVIIAGDGTAKLVRAKY